MSELLDALAAVNELASQYAVHFTLIHAWKKQLLAGAEGLFSNGSKVATEDHEAVQAQLYEQISRLKMEMDWVEKSCPPRLTPSGGWSRSAIRESQPAGRGVRSRVGGAGGRGTANSGTAVQGRNNAV